MADLPFLKLRGRRRVTVGEAVAAMGTPMGLDATPSPAW
jgi:S1-C subfamily serine protease